MPAAAVPPDCHFFKPKFAGCAIPAGPAQAAAYSEWCCAVELDAYAEAKFRGYV